MTQKASYLNDQGKHQNLFNRLEAANPMIGYTDNPNMNAFKAAYELYVEAALNGGRGIDGPMERAFNEHVAPVVPGVSLDALCSDKPDERAHAMDQVLAGLEGKPMEYSERPLWVNTSRKEHSFAEPAGERTDDRGWSRISFGNEGDRQAWVSDRSWSRDVTAEMDRPALDTLAKEAKSRAAEKNADRSQKPRVRKPPEPER